MKDQRIIATYCGDNADSTGKVFKNYKTDEEFTVLADNLFGASILIPEFTYNIRVLPGGATFVEGRA